MCSQSRFLGNYMGYVCSSLTGFFVLCSFPPGTQDRTRALVLGAKLLSRHCVSLLCCALFQVG